jgi:membrane protein DedA with SNARE-associated domain
MSTLSSSSPDSHLRLSSDGNGSAFESACRSLIGYGIGGFGRVDLLERHRIFHVNPERLRKTEGWFERYGDATVFFSRMLPIVRTFVSLPVGVATPP